jgi:hypothetical protein
MALEPSRVDFATSQTQFADDQGSQFESQTVPTGYTQQFVELPTVYHPSPIKLGEPSTRRIGLRGAEGGGLGAEREDDTQRNQVPAQNPGLTEGWQAGTQYNQASSFTQRDNGAPRWAEESQRPPFARVRSDSVLPCPTNKRGRDDGNESIRQQPPELSQTQHACPSGRPTISLRRDHSAPPRNIEMTNARDMVDGIRPPEAPKQVEHADTIVSVVRKATGLYMLEQEELEDLVAEVIREEGFADFVITTIGYKAKEGRLTTTGPQVQRLQTLWRPRALVSAAQAPEAQTAAEGNASQRGVLKGTTLDG